MDTSRSRSLVVATTLLLAGLVALCPACRGEAVEARPAAAESDAGLEFLFERVVEVREDPDGRTWVGFSLQQRWFLVDPDEPAEAPALSALARAALQSAQPVHATVLDIERMPKRAGASGGRPARLLRLAADPDPRRP